MLSRLEEGSTWWQPPLPSLRYLQELQSRQQTSALPTWTAAPMSPVKCEPALLRGSPGSQRPLQETHLDGCTPHPGRPRKVRAGPEPHSPALEKGRPVKQPRRPQTAAQHRGPGLAAHHRSQGLMHSLSHTPGSGDPGEARPVS
nr:uncharacterized protein LOC105478939 [Macaca nemestrina]